jgi:hypothetical protein
MSTEVNLPKLSINDLYQTGKSGYFINYEALEYLIEKRDFWYNFSRIAMATTAVTAILSLGFASGGAAAALKALSIATSFDRLISVVKMLLEAFDDEITIIPKVKTDAGKIELFVKTSDGRLFAFESRSKGTSQVRWREDRQDFFISSNQKTHKWSELANISKNLNKSVLALKKQKNEIVGKTNTQLRKPVTRAIILTGKTKIDPSNDEELFLDFGKLKKDDKKLLRVTTENTVFLLNQDDLVDFLMPPDKKTSSE